MPDEIADGDVVVAVVIGRVVVGDRGAGRVVGVVAGDGVGLLGGEGGGGDAVVRGLVDIELAEIVRVAARRTRDGPELVVADDHILDRNVAGIRDNVSEGDGARHGHVRAGGRVGVVS